MIGVHAIPPPLGRSALSESSPPHALRRLWTEGVWAYWPRYQAWGTKAEHTEAFTKYFLELFPAVDVEEYRRYRDRVRQAGWGQRVVRPAKDGTELLACMYQCGRSEASPLRAPG